MKCNYWNFQDNSYMGMLIPDIDDPGLLLKISRLTNEIKISAFHSLAFLFFLSIIDSFYDLHEQQKKEA
jgi:hypothetical protein